jgi:hypothetical protein
MSIIFCLSMEFKVIEELSYVVLLRKRFSYIKSIPRCFFHILHLLHTTVVYYSHDQLVEIIKVIYVLNNSILQW